MPNSCAKTSHPTTHNLVNEQAETVTIAAENILSHSIAHLVNQKAKTVAVAYIIIAGVSLVTLPTISLIVCQLALNVSKQYKRID